MAEKICLFCLALLLALPGNAQTGDAVAAFDSGYVETGNPFILHLSVPAQSGTPAAVDFSPWGAFLPAQNILRQSGWKEQGGRWTNDVTLITFDSAELALPPLRIVFPGGDTLSTNPLELRVLLTPSPDDPVDMLDIKDIHPEPANWRDYLFPVLIVAAGVLLLILAVWWLLFRKKKKKSGLRAVRTIQQPPHELALRKLAELERRQHWQNGRIKEFYSELTHILREYLERRYGIPALESPSEEILHQLIRTDMPAPLLSPLSGLLRWADLAKFAKGLPPESFHERAMQEVRSLVEQTKGQQPDAHPANGEQTTTNDPPSMHKTI